MITSNKNLSRCSNLVDKIFSPKGWLTKTLHLEHRPQQESMAKAISQALDEGSNLLVEAGTGVGKSLAYLIPGILFSLQHKRPFIISTHTKTLQEQIQNNDLPRCLELFSTIPELQPFTDFKTTLLMGRSNYLCTTRLAHALNTHSDLFPSNQQSELERILHWSTTTESGIVEELPSAPPPEVWDAVNADSSSCSSKYCKPNDCFFQKAKAQLRKSDIIILNHSLLFSLMHLPSVPKNISQGILFPNDFLVLDEAHTIPDIATDHFGLHISSFFLDRTLKTLYNPKTRKGLLTHFGKHNDTPLVTQTLAASEEFFNLIRQQHLSKHDITRLTHSPWTEPLLFEPLLTLIERLAILSTEQSSDIIKENLNDQRNRLHTIYLALQKSLSLEPKDHVHWVEKSGRAHQLVTIRTAPINIAPYLEEKIFNRLTSAILTSATLASNNTLDNFKQRIGATHEKELIENSPFDYEKNTQILITKNSPEPSQSDPSPYRQFLTQAILSGIPQTPGGTLALFTNYSDMHTIAETLENHLPALNRPLFVQGKSSTRSQLVNLFKNSGNGVLLGTDSYWTGIDIPGPALSHLIITRLPFENPTHPIKQAQAEFLQKNGQHPFSHLTLPEAIIKFRQGLGRLIRKKTDSGLITILDSRILSKPYGKSFLAALPKIDFQILN